MKTRGDGEMPQFLKDVLGVKDRKQTAQEDEADERLKLVEKELREVLIKHGVNFVGIVHFDFEDGTGRGDGTSTAKKVIARGHPHHVYALARNLWKLSKNMMD